MTPEQFCYWLAGALELTTPDTLDKGQLDMIRETLTTVIGDQMDEAIEMDAPAHTGGEQVVLDPNKSVEELIEAGLISRGLAKNVAAHVPDARPEQLDLFPIDRRVPRWPDETTYDPEAEILKSGGKVVNMRDMCAKMATEISSNR